MKEVLKIKKYTDEKGIDKFEWDFPDKEQAYVLIGIMEQIKLDLLDYITRESLKECEDDEE